MKLYTMKYYAKMEGSSIWYKGQIRNLTLRQYGQYAKQLNSLFNTKTFLASISEQS